MKRYCQILLSLFSATILHAGNPVSTIPFEDGEQFPLTLSAINFNRIDVEGERIVKVSYPENAFLVEQGKQALDAVEGAVVLKPLAHIPLTVYFTTNRNHHFSVTVTGSDFEGKTIKFVSKTRKGFDEVQGKEQDSSDETSDFMTALMEGGTLRGYQVVPIKPTSFRLHKQLKVTLMKQYQGATLSGYVYRIENQSNHPMELTPALFDHPKLVLMELSEHLLAPKQGGFFYGIYRENANVG